MDAGVALRSRPWSATTTGIMRVAIALAMAASLLLVGADRHWAVVAVGVCVQVAVALLLVRACVLRDESDGALPRRFAVPARNKGFFVGGGGGR
ncbi:hypothetical protein pmac_cds_243 [Pandoravirus macleodensis]|uniref:Uncharacterized protein n=1 Tax=Pandoravirus macleodensis TaxID=2107707 RepID=A0A2U7UEN0_9VIRU|nr:hypothetical protein pmac_cds_243 [Pandoravirus macleodensis]AVK76931.1 hypothetical protein pmac_cds_243 [Pandoravirus macleodensis]